MIFPQNLHTHTRFDDGAGSVRDMALAALEAGLDSIGFSGHSPLPFDSGWTMRESDLDNYIAEVLRVRDELRGRLNLYLGMEFDIFSDTKLLSHAPGFDYIIGAAHFIACGEKYLPVDLSAAASDDYIDTYFGGSAVRAAEAYYTSYDALARNPSVDIIAHLDLPLKFNEISPRFDESDALYREAASEAVRRLTAADKIFEINTGAVSRGLRTLPYPSRWLLRRIHDAGGKVTIASDSHHVSTVAFGFEEAAALALSCGFTHLAKFDGTEFIPCAI